MPLTGDFLVHPRGQALGIPTGLLASLVACKNGVKRAHLVDARVDGGLILELYSRDGVGTMISSDFYEVSCMQRLAGGRDKTVYVSGLYGLLCGAEAHAESANAHDPALIMSCS